MATKTELKPDKVIRRAKDWLHIYEAEKHYEGIQGMFRNAADIIEDLVALHARADAAPREQELRDALEGLLQFSDNVIEAWDIKPMPADRASLERARALLAGEEVK